MTGEINGDCFVVAAEIVSLFDMPAAASAESARAAIKLLRMMGVGKSEVRLCHGEVTRPTDQRVHTHAWVELMEMNDIVVDFSNGHAHMIPKETYYKAGKIKNRKDYEHRKAREMLVNHETYGPWEGEDE